MLGEFHNIKHPDERVAFREAVLRGIGRDGGLFLPHIDEALLPDKKILFDMSRHERAVEILSALIGSSVPKSELTMMVSRAFNFPLPVKAVDGDTLWFAELFHGPTLAFKDFGARFLAEILGFFNDGNPVTILTATSGDTGAAVAHAFFRRPGIRVVILYPRGKISPLQELMFTTLGENITTFAVNGDFDDCQSMVKSMFRRDALRQRIGLNSANSINVCRLLAQVCYYFDASSALPEPLRHRINIIVPSGNFGNLCAGIIGEKLGLPLRRFIAAVNINDTVPRYLDSGVWSPHPTRQSLANAMDVSQPNNWSRVEELYDIKSGQTGDILLSASISDREIEEGIAGLWHSGYLVDPHTAAGYVAGQKRLSSTEARMVMATAHPAKFQQTVQTVIGAEIELPAALTAVLNKKSLSQTIEVDNDSLAARLSG